MPSGYLNARLRSVGHAVRGLVRLVREEPNARIHAVATAIVLLGGGMLRLSFVEWGLIALAIACVWSAEAMNTAVEAVIDLVTPEHHALAAKAKDVAAGAVLVAACGSAVIGILVFVPRLLNIVL